MSSRQTTLDAVAEQAAAEMPVVENPEEVRWTDYHVYLEDRDWRSL